MFSGAMELEGLGSVSEELETMFSLVARPKPANVFFVAVGLMTVISASCSPMRASVRMRCTQS